MRAAFAELFLDGTEAGHLNIILGLSREAAL